MSIGQRGLVVTPSTLAARWMAAMVSIASSIAVAIWSCMSAGSSPSTKSGW